MVIWMAVLPLCSFSSFTKSHWHPVAGTRKNLAPSLWRAQTCGHLWGERSTGLSVGCWSYCCYRHIGVGRCVVNFTCGSSHCNRVANTASWSGIKQWPCMALRCVHKLAEPWGSGVRHMAMWVVWCSLKNRAIRSEKTHERRRVGWKSASGCERSVSQEK